MPATSIIAPEIRPFEIKNMFSKILENKLEFQKAKKDKIRIFSELATLVQKKMPSWMLETLQQIPDHSAATLFNRGHSDYKFKNLIYTLSTLKKKKSLMIDFGIYAFCTPLGKFWKIKNNNKISKTYKLPKIHKCFEEALEEMEVKTKVTLSTYGHLVITFIKL